jgi:hypothetical protein
VLTSDPETKFLPGTQKSGKRAAAWLDDILLPYVIDLSLFNTLDNTELKEHISRVGIVFYQADLK